MAAVTINRTTPVVESVTITMSVEDAAAVMMSAGSNRSIYAVTEDSDISTATRIYHALNNAVGGPYTCGLTHEAVSELIRKQV